MIYEKIAARSERLSAVARPVFKKLACFSNAALYRSTLAKLSQEYARNHSVERLVDTIYASWSAFLTVRPIQVKDEIGTANGGTLFLLTRVAAPKATLISIDKPNGSFGGGYPGSMVPVFRSFARDGQEVTLVRRDSHDVETFSLTRKMLNNREIDFLFIDGDHSYQGVKSDFATYSPLVAEGGMIGLHDIVPGLPSHVGDVPRFWTEVRDRYKSRAIVKDWNQGGAGIGLLNV